MKAKIRLLKGPVRVLLTGALCSMSTSCFYVWQEPIRYGQGGQPGGGAQAKPEPRTLDELQEERKASEKLEQGPESREVSPPPPPATPRQQATGIPVARSVPGREGFVFSPYNNKLIDVKGFPSGTRVRDPHFPESENKFFKVP